MERLMKTSRPMWCDEGIDVETAAVIEIGGAEAEFRETDGAQGLTRRAAGQDSPDGAEPQGKNNNPERKK